MTTISPNELPHVQMLADIANAGLVISICYGRIETEGRAGWSVDLLRTLTDETFEKPYRVHNVLYAIEVAHAEAHKRGWLVNADNN